VTEFDPVRLGGRTAVAFGLEVLASGDELVENTRQCKDKSSLTMLKSRLRQSEGHAALAVVGHLIRGPRLVSLPVTHASFSASTWWNSLAEISTVPRHINRADVGAESGLVIGASLLCRCLPRIGMRGARGEATDLQPASPAPGGDYPGREGSSMRG
jgi:hypothetical protein